MHFWIVLIPVVATVAGGVLAAVRPLGPRTISAAQHIAAGAVLGAVSAELVFELVAEEALWPLIVGFGAGTVGVLALRWWTDRLERGAEAAAPDLAAGASAGTVRAAPLGIVAPGLLAAVAVDVAVDGVVIGLGLEAGGSSGLLLTIALTLELLFLGAAVVGTLGSGRQVIVVTSALALLLPAGAAIGILLGHLSGFPLQALLAAAAAVLLFLVTEELLREAHEREDSLVNVALLFAAFLLIVVLDIAA